MTELSKNPRKIAAFFDVDGTILSKSSGTLYTKYMIREGKIGRTQMLKAMWYYFQHRLGVLDIEKMTKKVIADVEGDSESEMISDCNRWYGEMVRPYVRPQLVEVIKDHKSKGHNLALLTASTIYLAKPLGSDLGFDGYICNRLEVENGVFTGRMVEPLCYGEGKVRYAEDYASGNGVDLDKSYFYTDSITDMDFLLRVGRPVIINPDPLLRREAKKRNWPIFDYSHKIRNDAVGG